MYSKIHPSELAVDIELGIGFAFDAEPCFKAKARIENGRVVRPESWGLYLKDIESGIIHTGFIKDMPIEDYDGKSKIPLIIRKVYAGKEGGKGGVVHLEQRLEIGDTICLNPTRYARATIELLFTKFLSYNIFIIPVFEDGRKVYLQGHIAAIVKSINDMHTKAGAIPYERISQEQYEVNKLKIIRAKKD